MYGLDGIVGFAYVSGNTATNYYYRKNLFGDITAIFNGSGTVVARYAYDAWGNCTILQDTNGIGTLNPIRYRGYYFDTELNLYYLNARYYDPQIGRFISQDDISYLDPETLNGLNLFAYCLNNPVMGYDPDGTWDWGKFWKTIAVVAVAVVAVAAVAAVTVATGGTAAPVLVGAGIGAATSFGSSLITQVATTGTVDVGQLVVDTLVGGVMGAFGGSALGIVGMAVAGGVTGFVGSVANDFIAGNDINWVNAAISGGIGAFFGALSGGGAQRKANLTLKDKLTSRKAKIKAGKSTRSIDAQIKNERKLLTQKAIKAQLPGRNWSYMRVLEYAFYGSFSAYQHKGG